MRGIATACTHCIIVDERPETLIADRCEMALRSDVVYYTGVGIFVKKKVLNSKLKRNKLDETFHRE